MCHRLKNAFHSFLVPSGITRKLSFFYGSDENTLEIVKYEVKHN